jgi:hypothetical protein
MYGLKAVPFKQCEVFPQPVKSVPFTAMVFRKIPLRVTRGSFCRNQGIVIGGRLFGKWCIRDDVGKVGGCVLPDISNAEIPNDVVKGGRRLPSNDVAKAIFESVF